MPTTARCAGARTNAQRASPGRRLARVLETSAPPALYLLSLRILVLLNIESKSMTVQLLSLRQELRHLLALGPLAYACPWLI